MHTLVVSQNRLVGMGLVALVERCGLTAAPISVQQLAAQPEIPDLVLLYCERWAPQGRLVAEGLRARRAPFIVVARSLDAELRREVLDAGALHVFHPDETAELGAVLTNLTWSLQPSQDEFTLGNGAVVDLRSRRVQQMGLYRELTLTETRLLEALRDEGLRRRGQPVSMAAIVRRVWGAADARSRATLRGHVSRLRAKLEEDPSQPTALISRRGKGYQLVVRRTSAWVPAMGSS